MEIPDQFFKIIFADLKDFLVSIDRIEEAADFDFFSALADSVEEALGSVAAELNTAATAVSPGSD